ncbi:YbjN domain-containing protein [Pengzhenrongella frigida]|uniref:YbjN domain-containing protein n=1 Tax=Pengzhenrongella frigida TaxID=1259133 RepID=A0A4Q5N4X2_9MICO|nr:YbjN domain-containing protein [Cellulomonas sp. HLT2-17]RYV52453.1 YbjN domain-containing protein [Cellulomonas sp. HLT2-17]
MGLFRGGRGSGRHWPGRKPEPADEPIDPARPELSDTDLHAQVEDLILRELGGTPLLDDVPTPLSVARIIAWFEEHEFSYFLDNDGDLGGLWRGRLFYFFLFGEDSEILQIRGQWNREAAIERLEVVLEACNEWNADRIWPKAYVRVRDNGMVHVISEVATDLEDGVTDAQLGQLLNCGLSTGNMLFDAIDELFPDPAAAAP